MFALTTLWSFLRPDTLGPVTRVSVQIPEEQSIAPSTDGMALSPDGSLLVYQGVSDESPAQLWVRPWNALSATPIRGTEGTFSPPDISPDGQDVAFATGGSFRVVPIQGGVTRTLSEEGGCCPTWSPDGVWLYYSNPPTGLRRVPAGGGSPEVITEVATDAGDQFLLYPDVLPGGEGVVFQIRGVGGSRIQAVDVETREVKDLTPGAHPRYSPTGHLLFLDGDATLLAAPFDVESLELTGPAVPVIEGVARFAVSPTGTLVYNTGISRDGGFLTPVWVERDGTSREIDPGWRADGTTRFSSLALSTDGTRLAISLLDDGGTYDLWVKQLDSGPLSRVTFEGTRNYRATWSPDGQSLMFLSNRNEIGTAANLWTQRADGGGTATLVLDRELSLREGLHSPDGEWLVFRDGGDFRAGDSGDIYAIRPGPDSTATALVATDFDENSMALSPDGRWMTYVSNATGRSEVYVSPFPDAGSGRQLVSTAGGSEPMWAHSGRELFYRNGADELVAAQVTTGPTFTVGQQEVLFSLAGYYSGRGHPQYDVTPDDQRFVMLRFGDEENAELVLVLNFFEELKERVPN